ncbi:MAG: S8 family serine peptidase [Rhizobiales bacterium]|nr:S8 family serine peptidase [Hyphomicrobiales bacterium]
MTTTTPFSGPLPHSAIRTLARAISLALLLIFGAGVSIAVSVVTSGAAIADDDDGGDDGGGGSGGGGGGSVTNGGSKDGVKNRPSFRKSIKLKKRVKKPVRAKKKAHGAARPRRAARPTIVALDLGDQALGTLRNAGYAILRDETLIAAGIRVQQLRLPRNRTVAAARAEILALGGAAADPNAFYRPQQNADCADEAACGARELIAWPPQLGGTCSADVRIGVVDTRINLAHPALSGQRIETLDLGPPGRGRSSSNHGTAVVAILAGKAGGISPGLLPGAQIVHADPYYLARSGGDVAEVIDIVRSIGCTDAAPCRCHQSEPSGPAHTVVEEVLRRANVAGIVAVAAVGNAGPRAAPQFPAAYEMTVSVTALSSELAVYRRAGQGAHVDFSAPGVAVEVAEGAKGTVRKSGTSFAVPYITASLAVIRGGRPSLAVDESIAQLARTARDLGEPGKDPVYGWGLPQLSGVCGGQG